MTLSNRRAPLALLPAMIGAIGALAAGCGGRRLPEAVTVRGDPTPLARCKVAAGASSPLVTEWPASEKARLEGLTSEGGVVVSYSGCEMTILDGCKVEGNYAFQRTTLSSDTLEINDADDLYAKLPLGAASLEGELSRSGRLAVRTTVAGQVRFRGEPSAAPAGSACAGATHLVTAISVGAFRMLSGGAVRAGGGVEAFGAGAGGKVARAEEVLRESGRPDRCGEATTEGAHPDCNSPIQVFLAPIATQPTRSAPAPPPGPVAQPEPGTPPPGPVAQPETPSGPVAQPGAQTGPAAPEQGPPPLSSVQVSFPAAPDGVWTVQDEYGRKICQLPCSPSVDPRGVYFLQMETGSGTKAMKLPPVNYPGRQVDVELLPPRGSWGLGLAGLITGGTGMFVGGILSFFALAKEENAVPGLVVSGVSAGLLGGGIYWMSYSRRSYQPQYKISSGDQPPPGPQVAIGPGVLTGTF